MALIQNFETSEGFTGNYFNCKIENRRNGNKVLAVTFYASKADREARKNYVHRHYVNLSSQERVDTQEDSETNGCLFDLERASFEALSDSEKYQYLKTKKICVNMRGKAQVLDMSLSEDDI